MADCVQLSPGTKAFHSPSASVFIVKYALRRTRHRYRTVPITASSRRFLCLGQHGFFSAKPSGAGRLLGMGSLCSEPQDRVILIAMCVCEPRRQIRRGPRANEWTWRREKGSGRIDNGALRQGRTPISHLIFRFTSDTLDGEPDGVHRICRALPEGRQSYLSNAKGKFCCPTRAP